jgi:hypothetical protein
MASAAEFPFLIKNALLTQTKNLASIYGFKFWIRGKPWVVAIDDYLYMYNKIGINYKKS